LTVREISVFLLAVDLYGAVECNFTFRLT